MSEALVIVDVQNDFLPGGALAVPDGDAVIEPLNRLAREYDVVFATRDWHPPDHHSFESEGGPWPEHCVRDTEGAALHPDLEHTEIHEVVHKGERSGVEGYSAFDETDFERTLRQHGIDSLVIGGLAADVCVRWTALEARKLGFEVTLVEDAVRGVDVEEGDTERAFEEMRGAGVRFASSEELLREKGSGVA